MKNKYLTKYFCITLISAAVLAAPGSVFGAETGAERQEQSGDPVGVSAALTSASAGEAGETLDGESARAALAEPTAAPTEQTEEAAEPTPTETPTPTEAAMQPTTTPTPTEAAAEPTATPTPTEAAAEPTATPTPTEAAAEPTVTPTPTAAPTEAAVSEKIQKIIDRIDALSLSEITISSEKEIDSIRKAYDALTEEEKGQVTNYLIFVNLEAKLAEITQKDTASVEDVTGLSSGDVTAVEGEALYVTDMVSNLHAGKGFYLNSLSDLYHLSFSDDFASVMEEIEKEYKAANQLSDPSDETGVTTSADTYLVRNWQDILAVYVYRRSLEGEDSFYLDASCKEELAEIFAELNPLVADETDPSKLVYANYHINYYIKSHKIAKADRDYLKKYTETDCSLLCAVVTGARGFVRQSVGEDVSEERVNVITAAYSLIGKIGYFWGGKYSALGENPSWGSVQLVTATGSNSTGTLRAYGLDCSGFVTWSVINGYQNTALEAVIGNGTTDQWLNAEVISEEDAQPGDLVFQAGPESGQDNHVGIICGKTDAGDWIVVHCSSSQNGVTVGEAYGAGFRYIRRPVVYDLTESRTDTKDAQALGVTVDNSLAGLQEINDTVTDAGDTAAASQETDEKADDTAAASPETDNAVSVSQETDVRTERSEIVDPEYNSAYSDAANGQADGNDGQNVQSEAEEHVTELLSEVTVENALASLDMANAAAESTAASVPQVTAENALKGLSAGGLSDIVDSQASKSVQSTEASVSAQVLQTTEAADSCETAQTADFSAAADPTENAVQTVSYVNTTGSGGKTVSSVRIYNALSGITR